MAFRLAWYGPATWRAIAGAVLLALAVHALVLGWLASRWVVPAELQPMATPMFTRQILPTTPQPRPAAAAARPPRQAQPAAPEPVATPEPVLERAALPPVPEPVPTPEPSQPAATVTAAVSDPQPAPPPDAALAADPLTLWPADMRLSYRVGGNFRGELHGDAQVMWQREGERYQVQIGLQLGWLVSFVMTSQGRVLPQGLHPLVYEEKMRGLRRSVTFGESQIVLDNGSQVPRPDGVQDTASQFVELTWLLQSGQLVMEPGRALRIWLARPGGADEWTYDVLEQEPIRTGLGLLPAWHLVPRPLAKPRGNTTAEMWFAPGLQHLPVRIKMNMGSDTYVDLVLEKVEQTERKGAGKP